MTKNVVIFIYLTNNLLPIKYNNFKDVNNIFIDEHMLVIK